MLKAKIALATTLLLIPISVFAQVPGPATPPSLGVVPSVPSPPALIVPPQAAPSLPAAPPAAPGGEVPPSDFEEFIAGKSPLTVSTVIQQFGYDLFRFPPSTFAPVDIVPVGPDYLLGPGDEVRINVWGKFNAEFAALIDRDGQINLPQVGVIHLAGLTFSEAKEFLEKEFSRLYKPSEVKMNVSLGRLRSIRVFVVGKAEKPGSYTLSSFSTLINALFAAGGPSKIGTMRDIEVKRNGETLVHFDLYDFLLKGDKTKDVRLMPEDVIFIPTIGSLVGIAGNVKNPAIYELKDETRLLDLIQMAGGLTAIAFKGRVQVQRIEDHQSRTIFEGGLQEIEKNQETNFPLRDGDLVKIFSVAQASDWKLYRTVQIMGEVKHPGEYVVPKGETLSSLIERAGGFTDNAYLKGAIFTRESVKALQQKQLDESSDRLEQQVLSQSAATIEAALTPEAALQQKAATEQRRGLIAKFRAAKAKGRINIQLNALDKLKGSLSDMILEDGDTLIVPEKPQEIQVIGSVYNQTAFLYDPKASVSAYIKKAGGVTVDAEEDEMYVLKVNGTAISKREESGFLGIGGFMSFKLDPGDTIVVPEKIERIAWLREVKDLTQILYQIAVTAGVLIIAF